MRFRSTGLGKTELVGEIKSLERKGDYVILHLETTEPIVWQLRAGLCGPDLKRLLPIAFKFILRPRNFWFFLSILVSSKKPEGDLSDV